MKELINIYGLDEKGKRHDWIVVGVNEKEENPTRRYYYHQHNPQYVYIHGVQTLQEAMAYLWKNIINPELTADGIVYGVEKAK